MTMHDQPWPAGFVPPPRIQRIWYLFKRQHALEQKSAKHTADLHMNDFRKLAVSLREKRIDIIKAMHIDQLSNPYRSWLESKIDDVIAKPGRLMGV